MTDKNSLHELNRLIEVNRDAEAGFRAASETVKNSELDTLFIGYAKQHAKFATELQGEMKRLGSDFSDSGTLGGAVHRGWMDLKSALTGHSAASVLQSCESGEETAEIAYDDAIKADPTGQTHTLIEKHRQQIREFRTRLVRLIGETKNGVDFPTNE